MEEEKAFHFKALKKLPESLKTRQNWNSADLDPSETSGMDVNMRPDHQTSEDLKGSRPDLCCTDRNGMS